MGLFKKVNDWRLKELEKTEATLQRVEKEKERIDEERKKNAIVADERRKENEIIKLDKYNIREKLISENFCIDKVKKIEKYVLFIDDINKKFTVSNKKTYKIYNFCDLLDFELNEDGNSIVKGKTASTVAGGLMFGPIGAIAGASGRKKVDNECTYMAIRLLLNDLDNPELNIELIKQKTPKELGTYKKKRKEAQSATALLTYIQNNA